MAWLVVALAVASAILVFVEAAALWWLVTLSVWLAIVVATGAAGLAACIALGVVLVVPALILTIKPLRRALLSTHVLAFFRRALPAMSATERDAIEAGTVWWDAELFKGRPDWDTLLAHGPPALTDEERAFLDNECATLADLSNDWETTAQWQDLSPQSWQTIKQRGFLGLIIGRQYGGKGFSAYAHSQVVMKLSSRCSAAAVSVMVPNSLGPAELLLHYGTDRQKAYYLPRLASGEEIPCFALTSPYAGSDAAAIPDVGIVCKGTYEGRETIGFRVTWDKRYITLGPIATVLGLAFRVRDPDHLLGSADEPGITCALIPTSHPGVNIGRRHWPLNAVFQNGPNSGKDVFIPIDWVIGGPAQVGNGWRMLMESLAAGRAISLPSAGVGTAKLAVRGTSAYAALRRQFRTPIGKFEGIHEALGRMGGNLYVIDAMRRFCAQAVDLGERPAVLSAIAKYHVTERSRRIVNDAMDIAGGKGICMGPSNFLARAYQQLPISVTVEGANILTRSLIIFGQGSIRCHPYLLKEMTAARDDDNERALIAFDHAFFRHAAFLGSNALRSVFHGLTCGVFLTKPKGATPVLAKYYRAVTRLSIAFAIVADMSMLLLGGRLKRTERLSARLGDVLSQLVLMSATLKRFEDEGAHAEDLPFVRWGVKDALHAADVALEGLFANFPNRFAAAIMRALAFPYGLRRRPPSDALTSTIALLIQTPCDARKRLLADSHVPTQADANDPIACGERLLELCQEVSEIEAKLHEAVRAGRVQPMPQSLAEVPGWARALKDSGYLDERECETLVRFAQDGAMLVKVDDFPANLDRPEAAAGGANPPHSDAGQDDRRLTDMDTPADLSVNIDRH
ncbi:acyl-CoA dehydrogenase [Trinickia soli]|uniref:Acyl-coenzyme A dehydrogenase n=1 Tax=Trinickia soli TaxID=380675 RepID=A0A2N7W426_9BURK|nr:acyl-CoA dehydrogenase [Trinickia soli]PMS24146.1 acyl-CoA dehydrogenase [Trinickia soli]CAB3701237.1 Acyl-coenzyme A dehydrogenase [Trinickia soli]